ncbi:YciI family protein [Stenotrophomonas sp. PS02298]|uniref:YciI family protein n=1 Tax=Stenotrophomonas sp. PS02298 TaxID=2991424 RepID=UPI00249AD4BA|nr:YciI family protein [Stenotrophomonas sp. PS02298]
MKFMLLIYIDPQLLQSVPADDYDALMRGCLQHADALQAQGTLLMSQRLQPPTTAQTLRSRQGQSRIIDGPFAETREILAGFNLIEAADADEAMRIARQFPWAAYGSIEVRAVDDLEQEKVRLHCCGMKDHSVEPGYVT